MILFSPTDIYLPSSAEALDHHKFAISWLPGGSLWRNLRKILNTQMFTTQKLDANQELRRRKVQELLADVQEHCHAGKAVDIGQAAFKAVTNGLSNIIFSLDLIHKSSGTSHKDVVRGIMDELGKPNLADYFPILRYLDLQGLKRRIETNGEKLFDLYDRIINERMESRSMEGYVPKNDLLDTLLSISEENSGMMNNSLIKHTFMDLFLAGTDTSASVIEWAMTELLRNPRILRKARPRKPREEVELCGFTIPKGAQVLINVWAIGKDPSTWEDPESFVPERFLGSNIDWKRHNFELIPFGVGRRSCPGLPLADRMLQLILGSLLHSFDWQLEDGATPENMDMEERFGFSLEKAQPLRAVPIQP
ncbi:hypothetical protein Tsubulata_007195 [Turnera subulata]|uniref:Cytochrome P450 n=1 Tax=Turnera subulata TaxID=218843 RepID=A0A9Q0F733_9ROSI|nr:hypothetical protein Tsubulata_007195 [Turnera subulata]